ncbi:NAD(P)-binding domain-containing protein [Nocardia sp. NPDC051570]|uniref:NAD(P)-binding domain-containing protein n=1 Tax=Nocardia sp. NPDC051570 TaxID=3364324 RepID=UPI003796AB71
MNTITIVNQSQTASALQDKDAVLDLIADAYQAHRRNPEQTPRSHFLRFPDRPGDRIIALLSRYSSPARDLAGIKWVSSFPGNLEVGNPRAFASILLNDMSTGYPVALIAASPINAARTAASAALSAAAVLRSRGGTPLSIGLIGVGYIGRSILDYLHHLGIAAPVALHDQDPDRVAEFHHPIGAVVATDLDSALAGDIVIFATTAAEPYVTRPFQPGQVVLHVSLRDLAPTVVVDAQNIVDDADHALRERTSLELTRDLVGHTGFVTGTIPELLAGSLRLDERPVIISPFGLGILDIATAAHVFTHATSHDATVSVDFY